MRIIRGWAWDAGWSFRLGLRRLPVVVHEICMRYRAQALLCERKSIKISPSRFGGGGGGPEAESYFASRHGGGAQTATNQVDAS